MDEISRKQEALIARASRGRLPPEFRIGALMQFLSEKPEGEPIDPRWRDLWTKNRDFAGGQVSADAIRRIDDLMASLTGVDEGISQLVLSPEARVTFLLGAGASAPSGIPTVEGLLAELWEKARKIGREDLDRLADWCDQRTITNIEDLLTTAYIADFAAKSGSVTSLLDYFLFSGGRKEREREYTLPRSRMTEASGVDTSSISFLQDTLQTLFGLLTSTMISASPNSIHKAITDFAQKHEHTSIITTNYDGCMDEAILRSRATRTRKAAGPVLEGLDPIKMHGSINWAYCDSCQDVREFDLLQLKAAYEKDTLSYPVLGICKNCGGLRRPLLVPPLSLKFLTFPNLIDVWNSARQRIEDADYLIVVGYSFSESDTYITKIISRSMSTKEEQLMIVVNTDWGLAPSLRDRFAVHIEGFDDTRILAASGKGEETLPEILQRMLDNNATKRRTKRRTKGNSDKQAGAS